MGFLRQSYDKANPKELKANPKPILLSSNLVLSLIYQCPLYIIYRALLQGTRTKAWKTLPTRLTFLGRVHFSGEIGLLDSYYQSSRQIFFGSGKPSWPPRGPLHPSAVQLSAPKMRDLCQVPLDFVLTRKRACPPKGYTYPVVLVLKQQHERENTVAFASICGPWNPLPASRHCERDSWAAACSGILFSLINGRVLLERVSLNFASPGLSIVNWTLHKRKRFASNPAHQPGKLVFSLMNECVRLPTRDTGSIRNDFQHIAF